MRGSKLIELIVGLAVDHHLLLDPALFILGRAHVQKAAAVLEHEQLFAIRHFTGAVGDGGNAIAEISFGNGDVDLFRLLTTHACATGQHDDYEQRRKKKSPAQTSAYD